VDALSDNKVDQILVEVGAVLDGHFLLSSGNHASRYMQCAKLLEHPHLAGQVISVLAKKAQALGKIDVVIGPAMGGIIVAYELAKALGVRGMWGERDSSGNMTLRRGFEIASNERILIAEDVVTTGGSSLEIARLVKESGAKTLAVACIVDRRMEELEPPLPIISATRMQIPIYPPDDCPLCQQGIPFTKPGSRK
jgi:orotate phosphoribosyltransferase